MVLSGFQGCEQLSGLGRKWNISHLRKVEISLFLGSCGFCEEAGIAGLGIHLG